MSRHPLHCARSPHPNQPPLPPRKRVPAFWVGCSRASASFLAAPKTIRRQRRKAVDRALRLHRLAAARTAAMIAAAVSVAVRVAIPRIVTMPRTAVVTSVVRTGKRKTDVMMHARPHVKTAAVATRARMRVKKACPPARKTVVDVAAAKGVPTNRKVRKRPAKAGSHATAMMHPAARKLTTLKLGLLKRQRKLRVLMTANRSAHAIIRVTVHASTPSIRKLKPSKRIFRLQKPSKR